MKKLIYDEVRNKVLLKNEAIVLSRYLIVGYLGSGANAVVVRARDSVLQRDVAIKYWHLRDDREVNALQEMQKMASITSPAVVTVHDVGEWKARAGASVTYAVMEYVDGIVAKDWLKNNPDVYERYAVWTQYFKGLTAIYQEGVVHGDPHEENVFVLDRQGSLEVKLADFGFSHKPGFRREREPGVIKRTVKRIWGRPMGELLERFSTPSNLCLMMRAAAAFSEWCYRTETIPDREVIGQDNAWHLAMLATDVPLFRIRVITDTVASIFTPKDRNLFLNAVQALSQARIHSKGEVGEVEVAGNSTLDPSLPQVTSAYRSWQQMYLSEKLYARQRRALTVLPDGMMNLCGSSEGKGRE